MKRLRNFIRTSVLGGVAVMLPIAILIFVFKWVGQFIADIIQPITDQILRFFPEHGSWQEVVSNIIVVAIIILICFLIGAVVRTRLGSYLWAFIEDTILRNFPGYTLVRETVQQFFGGKKMPFSQVALVDIMKNGSLFTGFVTDEHEDGNYTVFVPTGPNPTSGNICHVDKSQVTLLDVPVEEAMRTIIACGAGSRDLITHKIKKTKTQSPAQDA